MSTHGERALERSSEARDLEHVALLLEQAARGGVDPKDAVYAAWFEACPAAAVVMAYVDEVTRGRMLTGVYELLLMDDPVERRAYLAFEIGNHQGYGALRDMYGPLFESLHQVLRASCSAAWAPAWDDAWLRRTTLLLEEIAQTA
jgi:hypothetical protein